MVNLGWKMFIDHEITVQLGTTIKQTTSNHVALKPKRRNYTRIKQGAETPNPTNQQN